MRRLLLIILFLSLITCTVKADTEMLLFSPDVDNKIAVGEDIDITVAIRPDQEIDTVAIDSLTWNGDILDFVEVKQGNLFENSLVWIEGKVDIGKLTGLCWGCNVPTSKDGDFITFTFKGIRDGQTEIKLASVGIARAGDNVPVTVHNVIVSVGSNTNSSSNGSYLPIIKPSTTDTTDSKMEMPVFFILSIMTIIIAIVLFLRFKKGR